MKRIISHAQHGSSSHLSGYTCRNWHLSHQGWLPGFIGPVPPPLLIRVHAYEILIIAYQLD